MPFQYLAFDSSSHTYQRSAIVLAPTNERIYRMLAQQPNLEIVAVEPNEAMVGKFKALQPHIEIHQAAAQDLPFEANSLDAVCAAQVGHVLHIRHCMTRKNLHVNSGNPSCSMQAFHWFANEDSLREIHRVLKPTGGFIMFANREDDRDSWARAILCSFEPYSKVSNA